MCHLVKRCIALSFLFISAVSIANTPCNNPYAYPQMFGIPQATWPTGHYGAYSHSVAGILGGCMYEQTEKSEGKNYNEKTYTATEASVEGTHHGNDTFSLSFGEAHLARASVFSSTHTKNFYTLTYTGDTSVMINDILLIENTKTEVNSSYYAEATEVDIEICSSHDSIFEGSPINAVSNFAIYSQYYRPEYHRDYLDIDGVYTPHVKITHTNAQEEICRSGTLKIKGKYGLFGLNLNSYTDGVHYVNRETIPTTHDLDGKIFANVRIRLPDDHKCYSASGVFPNCEREMPPRIASCPVDGGDESLLETEYHFETDYSDGLITFTRMYRSDDAWGGGAFGDHWRHNYEKKLNVITSLAGTNAENVTIGVPDDFGNETVFVKQDDGGWQAAESGHQQSLITVYDEFDQDLTVGYQYISESDITEHYDLNGFITRQEYQDGSFIDFAYGENNLLSTITGSNGNSLNFLYGDNGMISEVEAPSDLLSYAYDDSSTLSTQSISEPKNHTRTNPECDNSTDPSCIFQDGHGIAEKISHPVCDTVVGHGTAGQAVDQRWGDAYNHMDLDELSNDILTANPNSQCVILFICQSGRTAINEGDSVADLLSDKLKNHERNINNRDIPVYGPTGDLSCVIYPFSVECKEIITDSVNPPKKIPFP